MLLPIHSSRSKTIVIWTFVHATFVFFKARIVLCYKKFGSNFIEPNIFSTKQFLDLRFVWIQIETFLDKKYISTKFFLANIFLTKISLTKILFYLNFLSTKFLSLPKIFVLTKIFTIKFFWDIKIWFNLS